MRNCRGECGDLIAGDAGSGIGGDRKREGRDGCERQIGLTAGVGPVDWSGGAVVDAATNAFAGRVCGAAS
jgi:hypothetical protein